MEGHKNLLNKNSRGPTCQNGQNVASNGTQTNHSILNDRKQYHYENEVSYIDLNKANHIRLVRTFFDELKRLYCHKTISSNIYFCKSMSKKSMARSSALLATIYYIIEISIELHLHITTIKPVEKGSNQLQSIL